MVSNAHVTSEFYSEVLSGAGRLNKYFMHFAGISIGRLNVLLERLTLSNRAPNWTRY